MPQKQTHQNVYGQTDQDIEQEHAGIIQTKTILPLAIARAEIERKRHHRTRQERAQGIVKQCPEAKSAQA